MTDIKIADVLKLPMSERIRLVESIWDSIAEFPEAIELSDAQRAELDRRMEVYRKNPHAGSPWPEGRARILARS